MNVAEQDERRRPELRRDLRTEVGEDVELRIERGAAREVRRVAPAPAERLAIGVLDAGGIDAALLQVLEDRCGEVVSDDTDEAHGRQQRRGDRGVGGGASEDVIERTGRHLEIVERDGSNDEGGALLHCKHAA